MMSELTHVFTKRACLSCNTAVEASEEIVSAKPSDKWSVIRIVPYTTRGVLTKNLCILLIRDQLRKDKKLKHLLKPYQCQRDKQ